MADEDVVIDVHAFANESVALDLAVFAYCCVFLDLDEGADATVVTDRAAVEVDKIVQKNVFADLDVGGNVALLHIVPF